MDNLKVGDRLVCTKGYTHPNMGIVCRKGQVYVVKNYICYTPDGAAIYAIGRVREQGGIYLNHAFMKDHFIKEMK